jgi:hypothetical protein
MFDTQSLVKKKVSIMIGIFLAIIVITLILIYLYGLVEPVYTAIIISGVIIATAWLTHTRLISKVEFR